MAQDTLDIAAGLSGAAFRARVNLALGALGSTMKGPNAPPAPAAGMIWVEDDNPSSTRWTVRMYDGAEWIALGILDVTANRFEPASSAIPLWGGLAGGTANAIAVTVDAVPPAVEAGATLRFLAASANTGAVTVAIPGVFGGAARALVRGHGAPLRAGVLRPGALIRCVYDGTSWRLDEPTSGWMEVERLAVTGVAAVDITLQAANYRRFRIEIDRGRVATAGQGLLLRCGTGGAFDAGASDYSYGFATHVGATFQGGSLTAAFIDLTGGLMGSDPRSSIVVEVVPGSGTEQFYACGVTGMIENSVPSNRSLLVFGSRLSNAVRDQVRVFSSGAANIAGTVTVLGIPA